MLAANPQPSFRQMESPSPKDASPASSSSSSRVSSPSVGALLKIKILSWSQETGLPVTVRVRLGERTLSLHKNPIFARSGYFKKRLKESSEVELPPDFPGGPETFETIALFVYGSPTPVVDRFNVAALRCAAEFLEMTEDHSPGNLCERFDVYLNRVVLQSWDDTLIVLGRCKSLLPWSEELLIVSRCVESLSFMACMEILDPEGRREKPVMNLETLARRSWRCERVNEMAELEVWIGDLVALPLEFFGRIIGSLRRHGMKEKYVTPIIVFYANRWVLLSKRTAEIDEAASMLRSILHLLAPKERAGRAVPVGFYFALLSRSIELGLENDSIAKLQDQIANLLQFARVEDLLYPEKRSLDSSSISSSREVIMMEKIFSGYAMSREDSASSSLVAELWDAYLSHIASDPNLEPKRLTELLETVPVSWRRSHDHLYRAMNAFLQAHHDLNQDEKAAVCKYLDCQKLSPGVCVEAVRNDMLPLRLIVQILFVQQLDTHRAFKACSESFRSGEFSRSLKSQHLIESPYATDGAEETPTFYLQQELITSEFSHKEYESTSFRIHSLEQELMSLQKTIHLHNAAIETRPPSKKPNQVGHVTSCMNSVNLASQRKYAQKLLKFFRRISLFGSRRSNRKKSAT